MNAVTPEARPGRDTARRDELLAAAADYVLAHGLAGLSVRPLAAALGLSHRTLLYHFASKDKLILDILDVVRARDGVRIADYLSRVDARTAAELFRSAWAYFSAPERAPYTRFFHEVFALGLHAEPYRTWVAGVLDSRAAMIAAALATLDMPEARTRAAATMITAAVRGLQLHLLTTGDRELTDAAFEELLAALEARLRS